MMSPLVTVIIPCHNEKPEWLYRAVESADAAIRKMDAAGEIIVVDDCSDDPSVAPVCREKSSLITWVLRTTNNSGPSTARNMGLEHAKGKYILPLDADNWIEPDCLVKLVNALESAGPGYFAYSDVNIINARVKFPSILRGREYVRKLPEYDLNCLYHHGNYIDTCALYGREDALKAGGYNPDTWWCEDWEFWFRMAAVGVTGIHIPEPLFTYNSRLGSLVSKYSQPEKDEIVSRIRREFKQLVEGVQHSIECPGSTVERPLNLKVEVVIPTVDRPKELAAAIESIQKFSPGTAVRVFFDNPPQGVIKATQELFRQSYEAGNDITIFLGDDCLFKNDVVARVERIFKKRNTLDLMVGLNQGKFGSKYGFFALGRTFIERFPDFQILNPQYHHYFGDTELGKYAKSVGKYIFGVLAHIEHIHDSFKKGEEDLDETGKLANTFRDADEKVFEDRVQRGNFWPIA